MNENRTNNNMQAQPGIPNFLELLKACVDHMSDAIVITEADPISQPGPRIVWVNQSFYDLTGYSPEEVIGNTPRMLQGPGTDRATLGRLREAFSQWRPVCVEVLNYRKDGSAYWNEFQVVPVANDQGWFTHWVSVQRDVTERKRKEEAFRNSLDRLKAAALAGIVGLWDWDIQNHRLDWDQVMYRLYGIREEDWQGCYEAWASAIHPEDRAYVEDEIQAALRAEQGFATEFRIILPDGQVRYLKAASHTTFDANGKALRMIGVNYDLTEQKNIEQRLVQERNRADEAAHAKSDFLAKMSHELRTPMNGIRGYLQLARDETSVTRANEYLDAALKSSRLMSTLLNDLLDFSRIEAGKLEIERRSFNLLQAIDSACKLHRADLQARSSLVTLHLELADGLPEHVIGDELRLTQVINNLLSNAVKFTQVGEIVLRVSRARAEPGHDSWRFEVSDSGIGIDESQINRLFNAFEQGDNSINRRYGGSGLGLVISQQLVRLMGGGPMSIESTLGQGSCVAFTLPLPLPAASGDEAKVESMQHEPAPRSLAGLSVLVVEDNPTNIDVAVNMLESMGAEVSIATNGRDALEVLHELGPQFDLVLMDMQMPEMDGLEATRQIKAHPDWKRLPVVAMTANALEENRHDCQEVGMSGFIAKPIEKDELLKVVLEQRRAA